MDALFDAEHRGHDGDYALRREHLLMRPLEPRCFSNQSGFSLIEVLVALIIIAVGMLGLAKIQALAYGSTGTANLRSLAAIQASSIASAMHSNRNYWSSVANGFTYGFVGTATVTSTDSGVTSSSNTCTAAACTATQIAALDLANWHTAISGNGVLPGVLPNATANIACAVAASAPVACTIQLQWSETTTAINSQSSGYVVSGSGSVPYTLYVVP
jgi:type IV pilus assembly protein PilV